MAAHLTTNGGELSAVVALSGGVDSAVAAWRLREEGYATRAIFMKNWEEDDADGRCAAADDLRDAEAVCEHLGIELRTVNFSAEYWENVFSRCLDAHRRGQTPNPDVLCNREIKFDVFLDYALSLGAERVATGHYARIDGDARGLRLLKGRDAGKDQSYFLYTLGQAQLAKTLFPLGGLTKTKVRAIARRVGLPTSEKKDSTGLCFIGERPFKAFLSRFIEPSPGPIVATDGSRVGRHDGLAFYTIGQRRGLGIGGRRSGGGEPWYAIGKDLARNTLFVAQGRDHPALYRSEVEIAQCRWTRGVRPRLPARLRAKTRYRQPDEACTVEALGGDRYRVRFARAQWAPAPGQSLVLYRDDECLGGGIIGEWSSTSARAD